MPCTLPEKIQNIRALFTTWSGQEAIDIKKLPESGSYREYFRVTGNSKNAIGVYNPDLKENIAFLTFTKHFFNLGLPVPELYLESANKDFYLIQDLGDRHFFNYLVSEKGNKDLNDEITLGIFKRVIDELQRFQFDGGKGLDYSLCYPRNIFDKQAMMWDLNYFKYHFLKIMKVPFDEQLLEDDFQKLTDYLGAVPMDYFMYRDFQSRNIMLDTANNPYFIDYQGGRKGPLQYDLASLLYEGKINLTRKTREELLDYYISSAQDYINLDRELFKVQFYLFVLIRLMQAMGAYGFRGLVERKALFVQSIPYGIRNLASVLENLAIPFELPQLMTCLTWLVKHNDFKLDMEASEGLKISILSFSYKKGIPEDFSGNGGGFVFDCRAVHNPGRYEEFKLLTGKDKAVIEFLDKQVSMKDFLSNSFGLIDASVDEYLHRGFNNLMICFGCTGGQHRSVYAAENLVKHLQEKYKNVKIQLRHREIDNESI